MMFIILTQDNQSTLSSFSLFLRFVTIIPVAEKGLSGSTDMGLIVIKPWNSFSRLFDLFSVASKRLISFFIICDWISSYAGIVSWPSLSVRARLRKGNGSNCPGPSPPRRTPWWHLFVLNKIFVWKIVVIQKRYKNTYSIFRCYLSIINEFDFLPVLVITTEYKYFRFCSMQIYLNFAWNFSQ